MSKYYRLVIVIAVLVIVIAISGSSAVAATTYHVGAGQTYSKIQNAINTSEDGDTVLVHNGTYVENINFNGKAITVKSENGADSTTINGNADGSVVTFSSGEENNSILEGFKLTNGSGFDDGSGYTYGGGIYCYQSSPMITNCTIIGNTAVLGGGGVYCKLSSPSITNCSIKDNSVTGQYYGDGGGIFCSDNSSPMITNCIIGGNTASDIGGGISCNIESSPKITNCTISGNSVIGKNTDSRSGGGIHCNNNSSPTIINCTIIGNSANGSGGGIYCGNSSSPTISHCIISGNSANGSGGGIICARNSSPMISNCNITGNTSHNGRGGGIFCNRSSPTITNCTISGNTDSLGWGGIYCYTYSSPYIVNTILWNNGSEVGEDSNSYPKLSYCNIQGGYSGLGNIDDDPLFVNPGASDYCLGNGSPCIDAGHPRMYDSDSSRSDMGACGGGGGSDPNSIYITVAADGSGDYTSIQDAINVSVTGDTITVIPGTYAENIVIGGKEISLISQEGVGFTIIDGSGSSSVIVLSNIGSDAVVQGFTIQNGSGYYGGGIYYTGNSSASVTNLRV